MTRAPKPPTHTAMVFWRPRSAMFGAWQRVLIRRTRGGWSDGRRFWRVGGDGTCRRAGVTYTLDTTSIREIGEKR
jgi:hypothetical protein